MTVQSTVRWIRETLDDVSEHWIGFAFPPAARAIEEAKWNPDELGVYCRRCGDTVGPGEATRSGCATCRDGGELAGGLGGGVIRLGTYADELRGWVRSIKFQRWSDMGDELGRLLSKKIREAGIVDVKRTIVVPMPMPWQRRMFRGIDHTRVIAHAISRDLRRPVVNILAKSMQPPQVTLAPSERKRRGSRGLRVRRRLGGWPIQDYHVVLVDDVRTTGSTLRAAARLLKTLKPAKVVCAVLAVSDSKARRQRAQVKNMRQEALLQ